MARSFTARPTNDFRAFRPATKDRARCNCMTHGDSTSQTECKDRSISASERAKITAENSAEFETTEMSLNYEYMFSH